MKVLRRTAVIVILCIALAGCSPAAKKAAPPTTSTQPDTSTVASAAVSPPAVPPSFGGNAHPTLRPGKSGRLDIIDVGSPYSFGSGSGADVPVEVWNGTSRALSGIEVSGQAISESTAIASGESDFVQPGVLAPGDVAFGIVRFHEDLPSGVSFTLSATGSADTTKLANVQVVEAKYMHPAGGIPGNVGGTVTNPNTAALTDPIPIDLYCFSSTGVFLNASYDFVILANGTGTSLPPGATAAYDINLESDVSGNQLPCPTFLVGSSGNTR